MLHEKLRFDFTRPVPMVHQAEAAECGLACMAMILRYYGYHLALRELRLRFAISLHGTTLEDLSHIASRVELGFRAVTLELDDLKSLRLPCILHWDFKHFVVLTKVSAGYIYINDPSGGTRRLSRENASKSFTGVAVELWPNSRFKSSKKESSVSFRQLVGKIDGLFGAVSKIAFLALAIELLGLAFPLFMKWLMDYVIISEDASLLVTLALGFGLLLVVQQVITGVRAVSLMYFNTLLTIQWRANLFSHLLSLPVEYFAKRHIGDISSKFGSIEQIQRVLTSTFLEGFIDGLFGILAFTIMLMYSPSLASVTLGTLAFYFLIRCVFFHTLRSSSYDLIVASSNQQTHFIESIRGIRTLKLFQREEIRCASWGTLLIAQINADLHLQRVNLSFRFANSIIFGLENIFVVALGASFVISKSFSAGSFIAYLSYKAMFAARTVSLIEKTFDLRLLQLQNERLADIALTEPEAAPFTTPLPHSNHAPALRFENVSFRYSDSSALVLEDITFSVEPGESVVLVGPSGCGKTTIASILLGIYKPTSGRVMIDGEPLSRLGPNYIRQHVATVMQDDTLFAGSIFDNITFFDPHPDLDWAVECAKSAYISNEIDSMPMGYYTLVGDMGSVLSGGQKQRILLARAMYKRPKILILDEATSHLDIPNEKLVNAAIKRMKITRFLIAHRPETMLSADKMVRILEGKVTDICMVASHAVKISNNR